LIANLINYLLLKVPVFSAGIDHFKYIVLGPPVSSTNKTCHHAIAEILLKVALNTIKQANKQKHHFQQYFS
jgi:hypothetical protein